MINKKYLLTLMAVATVSSFVFVGCGNSKSNNTSNTNNATQQTDNSTEDTDAEGAYTDGSYTATASEAENGYTYEVTMTVEGGNITAINWDANDADGNSKKEAAKNGSYDMHNEGGLNWADQSDAISQYVIDNQSLDSLTLDDSGKTDAVSGVTISVSSFVELLQDCITQATN